MTKPFAPPVRWVAPMFWEVGHRDASEIPDLALVKLSETGEWYCFFCKVNICSHTFTVHEHEKQKDEEDE